MSFPAFPPPAAPTTPTRSRLWPLLRPLSWAATVLMGLMAGLFFAFAVAVMPGLARTDDRTFVATMQAVNRAIENLPFATAFLGSLVCTGAAVFVQARLGLRSAARWTLAALALYITALVITTGTNIPLNDRLAAVTDGADLAAARVAFESSWVPANNLRTVACVLALGCLARALALQDPTRARRG